MFRYLENLVDPYCDYPEKDRPPTRLWPFLRDYAQPFRKLFAVTALMSVIVAGVEIWLIAYIGRLVDVLASTAPAMFWQEHGTEMILMVLFLLFLRPALQLIDVGLLNNAILPNFGTLIRWRAHKHVLRQSVGWFENDFAGRIANRIMQTPPAAGEVVFQVFDAISFSLAYLVGAAILLAAADSKFASPRGPPTICRPTGSPLSVNPAGTLTAGKPVTVTLRRDGSNATLAERRVTISEEEQSQSVRLSFRPPEEGDFRFVVEAQPIQVSQLCQKRLLKCMLDQLSSKLNCQNTPTSLSSAWSQGPATGIMMMAWPCA